MASNSKSDTDPNHWQLNQGLVSCNRHMLTEAIASDVTFQVGPEGGSSLVAAHKYMLMCRSPVFYAMFSGGLAEATDKSREPIKVPDIEAEAFKQMLFFIYCEECQLSPDIVLPTLYASKKYLLPALTDRCTTYLEENLQPDNVCLIYEQSLLYEEQALVTKCVAFIETRTEEVLHSPAFTEVSHACIVKLLQLESLAVSELELFTACLKWAKEECKRQGKDAESAEAWREALGQALYLLRFPTMTLKDFANSVSKTGILTAEEKCQVYDYIACDDAGENPQEQSRDMVFSSMKRRKPQPSIVRRFTTFSKSNVYSGDCSIMKMSCDAPVLIKGFGVSGSMSYDPLAEVQITIKHDRNFLCNKSISVKDDLSGDVLPVMLPEGALVQPHTWYTVIVTFHFYGDHDQGSCRRGKGGYKSLPCDGVNFEFDRSDTAGFVPEILFCRV